MSTFDYKCPKCGFAEEYCTNESVPAEMHPPEICPECGKSKLEKLFSPQRQIFDCPGAYDYTYGKKAWKKNLSLDDQAKVIAGEKSPY